jgi:hypothetical protein
VSGCAAAWRGWVCTLGVLANVIRLICGSYRSEWSRVYYSIDVRVPDWIPTLVINILNTQALTQVGRQQGFCRC